VAFSGRALRILFQFGGVIHCLGQVFGGICGRRDIRGAILPFSEVYVNFVSEFFYLVLLIAIEFPADFMS